LHSHQYNGNDRDNEQDQRNSLDRMLFGKIPKQFQPIKIAGWIMLFHFGSGFLILSQRARAIRLISSELLRLVGPRRDPEIRPAEA
jgi:hypothetical protein